MNSLKAKLENLTKETEALKMKKKLATNHVYQGETGRICEVCHDVEHSTKDCPALQEMRETYIILTCSIS